MFSGRSVGACVRESRKTAIRRAEEKEVRFGSLRVLRYASLTAKERFRIGEEDRGRKVGYLSSCSEPSLEGMGVDCPDRTVL